MGRGPCVVVLQRLCDPSSTSATQVLAGASIGFCEVLGPPQEEVFGQNTRLCLGSSVFDYRCRNSHNKGSEVNGDYSCTAKDSNGTSERLSGFKGTGESGHYSHLSLSVFLRDGAVSCLCFFQCYFGSWFLLPHNICLPVALA